ncbi:MAG: hypothetical protein IH623_03980 [Verrucomicrobia bacterium]|nr:hypothetical protein [Verrucomicrobiota bacterium]
MIALETMQSQVVRMNLAITNATTALTKTIIRMKTIKLTGRPNSATAAGNARSAARVADNYPNRPPAQRGALQRSG